MKGRGKPKVAKVAEPSGLVVEDETGTPLQIDNRAASAEAEASEGQGRRSKVRPKVRNRPTSKGVRRGFGIIRALIAEDVRGDIRGKLIRVGFELEREGPK